MKTPISNVIICVLTISVFVVNVQGLWPDSYTVDVYTSDLEGAGSSAYVSVLLYGRRKNSGYYHLSANTDEFNRGRRSTHRITISNSLGSIRSVRVWYHDQDKYSPWKLNRIEIRRDRDTSNFFVFTCHCWFYPEREFIKELELDETLWTATVVTGNKELSITDNVYIIVVGHLGETEEKQLYSKHYEFRNGTTVTMDFVTRFVGAPEEIKVRHHSTDTSRRSWNLDTIQLVRSYPQKSEKYLFNCHIHLKDNSNTSTTCLLARRQLHIKVFTTDTKHAGTDGIVKFQVGGNLGHSEIFRLDTPADDFERNTMSEFYHYTNNIGTLEWVKVWLSREYGWSLYSIWVSWIGDPERHYIFDCKCWVTKLSPYKYLTAWKAPTIPPWARNYVTNPPPG